MLSKVISTFLLQFCDFQIKCVFLCNSDGYMFRYKIAVPREIALHMKEVTTKGVTKYRDTTQSTTMERELILQPKITVSLHTYVVLI